MQERCALDARKKIIQWGGSEDEAEQAIRRMMKEDFMSEARYIQAYVRVTCGTQKMGAISCCRRAAFQRDFHVSSPDCSGCGVSRGRS